MHLPARKKLPSLPGLGIAPLLLSALIACLWSSPAAAQQGKAGGAAGAVRKPPPGVGGAGGSSAREIDRRPPILDKSSKKPATKKTKPSEQEAPELDENGLPKNYVVPVVPEEWVTTTDEWKLSYYKDTREYRRANTTYNDLLSKGEFSSEVEKKAFADMLRYKLAEWTLKDKRDEVARLRSKLLSEISRSGMTGSKKKDVRKFALRTLAEEAPKLLRYHLVARLNAAILLADLSDITEVDAEGAKTPAIHFKGAYGPLFELLKDAKGQPVAARVWAVKGLVRLATLPDFDQKEKGKIIEEFVAQLGASADEYYWFQMRLADGLGQIGSAYVDKKPIVAQALAEVLVDTARHWVVRSEAACALGRLNYNADIDVGLIAHEIAQLARQMTASYAKNPKNAIWKVCYFKLYCAFKPVDDEEAKAGKGLLTQVTTRAALGAHRKTVQEVYDLILPLVQNAVNEAKDVAEPQQKLTEWLKNNPPTKKSIAEGEKPIISDQRTEPPDTQPAAGG